MTKGDADQYIDDLARMWNPILHGHYYGRFYRSAYIPCLVISIPPDPLGHAENTRKLRRQRRRAVYWLGGVARREPRLFAHWYRLGVRPARASAPIVASCTRGSRMKGARL